MRFGGLLPLVTGAGALALLPFPERLGSEYDVALGVLGTLSLVLMQLYSLRRRGRMRTGRTSSWLRVHAALGSLGAVLILLHSGLHVAGFAGMALILLLVEAGSGALGKLARVGSGEGETRRDLFGAWRDAHVYVAAVFTVLVLTHLVEVLYY